MDSIWFISFKNLTLEVVQLILMDQNVTYCTYIPVNLFTLGWGWSSQYDHSNDIPQTINRGSYSAKQVVRWRNKTTDKQRYIRSELEPTKTTMSFILLIIKAIKVLDTNTMYQQLLVFTGYYCRGHELIWSIIYAAW